MLGAAIENAHLPIFSLAMGIESCSKVNDLHFLGMCRTLAKSGGSRIISAR